MSTLAREALRTRRVAAEDGVEYDLHSNISERQGEFLQRLVERFPPKLSVEIGLAYGVSALFLCDALARVGCERHIVLDPGQRSTWHGVGLAQLRRAGFGALVDFRERPSHLALPELVEEGLQVDFAFVDGNHLYDYVALDFFYLDKLLPVGGVIAFDDANWPSVRRVLRFALKSLSYSVVAALPIRWKKYLKRSSSLRGWRDYHRDRRLGISAPGSRCIALRKDGPDRRDQTFDVGF